MLLAKERQLIVDYGKKLVDSDLTKGTSGNISIFNRKENLIAISPTGIDYYKINPEDVVILDIEGNVIEGTKKPSSEKSFHLALYKYRDDINSVVHTHSAYATTFACLGMEIPAVHYMVALSGKKVPIAKYETFGTLELSNSIIASIEDYNAILLSNHGLVAVGGEIDTAFKIADEIEYVARIYYQTLSIGKPKIIDDAEMEIILDKFKTYGQN
jgi:L-fuculose-phosphate aldolase